MAIRMSVLICNSNVIGGTVGSLPFRLRVPNCRCYNPKAGLGGQLREKSPKVGPLSITYGRRSVTCSQGARLMGERRTSEILTRRT